MVLLSHSTLCEAKTNEHDEASLEERQYRPVKLSSQQQNCLDKLIDKTLALKDPRFLKLSKFLIRGGVRMGRLGSRQKGVPFDDPSHCDTTDSIARTALKASFFLTTPNYSRSPNHSQLDLTTEEVRHLSAYFSLSFFKMIKKLISNLRGRKKSREAGFQLLLALAWLDIILRRSCNFLPEYGDMQKHLDDYIDHYKTKLERMLGPAESAMFLEVRTRRFSCLSPIPNPKKQFPCIVAYLDSIIVPETPPAILTAT